jgi:hypothetical protein
MNWWAKLDEMHEAAKAAYHAEVQRPERDYQVLGQVAHRYDAIGTVRAALEPFARAEGLLP